MFSRLQEFDASAVAAQWQDIGFDEEERATERGKLEAVLTAIHGYESALSQTHQELCAKIESVCSEYTSMMKALDLPVEAPAALQIPNLRGRLAQLTSEFDDFKDAHRDRLDEVIRLASDMAALFEKLECDRSEFPALDSDGYTAAHVQRLVDTRTLLQERVAAREAQLEKRFASINKLSSDMELIIPQFVIGAHDSRDISTATTQKIVDCEAQLIATKRLRAAEIDAKKSELRAVLETLQADRRQPETTSHGESVITSLAAEIAGLRAQRKEQLPRIIEFQAAEVARLKKLLHRAPETDPQDSDLDATCDRLEARLKILQKEFEEVRPIVELIAQREELIRELHELNDAAK
jgi:hypothetical protein